MSIVCFLSSTDPCMNTHMFVFICMGGLARKGIMREDEAFLGRSGWNRCDEKTEEETESGKKGAQRNK